MVLAMAMETKPVCLVVLSSIIFHIAVPNSFARTLWSPAQYRRRLVERGWQAEGEGRASCARWRRSVNRLTAMSGWLATAAEATSSSPSWFWRCVSFGYFIQIRAFTFAVRSGAPLKTQTSKRPAAAGPPWEQIEWLR
uniref:Putative secreted protein n=1 Tax=Anopheles darlingi TaxID=43151 RepID=A0A2M4D0K9_ANODA